ncbi:uncharacterized protein LOC129742197 [Uranotaenia lowii]|uniref:uncharacterized protein LOC129742197 n=1 Tax=Uranotaenia lowii TaxID=190385 RepID=UPI00247A34DB|nr:uncharacterized protein LOC129742197 [Uranotaenia lowii]
MKGPEDTVSLQRQFNLFATWCSNNCLALNRSKCSIITFSRKRHPILADYFLSDHLIARVDHINDLGVVLDQKLYFKTHTNYIVDKASRCLGLIFRVTKDFRDVYCLKSLYCSLVRSILEYASAVWSPFYQNGADRIEALQ